MAITVNGLEIAPLTDEQVRAIAIEALAAAAALSDQMVRLECLKLACGDRFVGADPRDMADALMHYVKTGQS